MKLKDGTSMADKKVMAVYIILQEIRHSRGKAGLKEALRAAQTGSSDAEFLDKAWLTDLKKGGRMHPETRRVVKLAVTGKGELQEPW